MLKKDSIAQQTAEIYQILRLFQERRNKKVAWRVGKNLSHQAELNPSP